MNVKPASAPLLVHPLASVLSPTQTTVPLATGLISRKLAPELTKFATCAAPGDALPTSIDLRADFPNPYDQGNISSCVPNAVCAVIQFLDPTFMGSRLFIYYQARLFAGFVGEDVGCYLDSCVRLLEVMGIPAETEWKYDPLAVLVPPPTQAYATALNHRVLHAANIELDPQQLKGCINNGFPFLIGCYLFSGIKHISTIGDLNTGGKTKGTGIVPLFRSGETPIGEHAVVVVGYDDDKQWWIVCNSWGKLVGDNGHFYFPYAYFTDKTVTTDIWTIRVMSNGPPIDCLLGDWVPSGVCTLPTVTTCGTNGLQTYTRSVTTQRSDDGAICNAQTKTESCAGPLCPPPTNCVLGEWTQFSACDAVACGTQGQKTRTRIVVTPPANNGTTCASLVDTESCTATPCPVIPAVPVIPPVNCLVSAWSAYSSCDALSCGKDGIQTSTRTVITPATNGGAQCPELLQKQHCKANACQAPESSVDCKVTSWSDWSACSSTTCRNHGIQKSTRNLITKPKGEGDACPELIRTRICEPSCDDHDTNIVVIATLIILMLFAIAGVVCLVYVS